MRSHIRVVVGVCLCSVAIDVTDPSQPQDRRSGHDDADLSIQEADILKYEEDSSKFISNEDDTVDENKLERLKKVREFIKRIQLDYSRLIRNVSRRDAGYNEELDTNVQSMFNSNIRSVINQQQPGHSSTRKRGILHKIAETAGTVVKDLINKKKFDANKEDIVKSVDELTEQHRDLICKNFSECRSRDNLVNYFLEFTTVVLRFPESTLKEFAPYFLDSLQQINWTLLMDEPEQKKIRHHLQVLNELPIKELLLLIEDLHKMLFDNHNHRLQKSDKYHELLHFLEENTILTPETSSKLDACRDELMNFNWGFSSNMTETLSKVHDMTQNVTIESWTDDVLRKGKELIGSVITPVEM